jgi:hypothetical protein
LSASYLGGFNKNRRKKNEKREKREKEHYLNLKSLNLKLKIYH